MCALLVSAAPSQKNRTSDILQVAQPIAIDKPETDPQLMAVTITISVRCGEDDSEKIMKLHHIAYIMQGSGTYKFIKLK